MYHNSFDNEYVNTEVVVELVIVDWLCGVILEKDVYV